ncbi:MAG TPA: nodulation protein NfeD [Bryobacteraceae bacterium]|nr:nodulation protein NfeD [Bryobacteraceae bacterium]
MLGADFRFTSRSASTAAVRYVACVLTLILLLFGVSVRQAKAQASADNSGTSSRVIELRIGDEVEPIMAEYIDGGIAEAAKQHANLVLITMDTPGGLGTSMEDMIQHILASPVPVAVYVSPTGARGASAGFFILMSADVAAMAPGTHAGAASPLLEVGGFPLNVDQTLKNKILNDATAFLRSYVGKRGRNVQIAETAVTDGKAFTDTEALNDKLIDLIANSPEDLLAKLNGQSIKRFDGSTTQLNLDHPQIVSVEMSARERFLARIVQPDAFFILLIAGALGLYIEFTHPGMVAPGVIGAIALVLALFAMHILPVNFAGLLLIVVALGLFILEAKYTSHGVLAAGGIIAMMLGAFMLIRSPITGAGVSFGVALGMTLPCALVTIFLMRLVLRSRSWKQSTGTQQLLGEQAEVTDPITAAAAPGAPAAFQGMVRLHGELWRAVAPVAIPAGAQVRVVNVTGLTVHVTPAESGTP